MSVSLEYDVVTEDEFPNGLRCIRCDREIEPGQPYSSGLALMLEDGAFMTELHCVYCNGR